VTRATNIIRSSTLAVVIAVLALGCSTGDSEESSPSTTAPAAAPTPDNLKLAVFERAYSECASTEFEPLAAKYKVEDKTRSGVATAVGLEWVEFFGAGQDAVPDGRSGCLQGFDDR